LLTCPRVRGMVRNFMIKRGVSLNMVDDVMSDMAVVMQLKMLDKLEKTSDVYYVIYRVAQLVVSNYGKKSINTSRSEEVSISSLIDDSDDESGALERLSSESALDNQDEETEKRIDIENAKRRFTDKLNAVGWHSGRGRLQALGLSRGQHPARTGRPQGLRHRRPQAGRATGQQGLLAWQVEELLHGTRHGRSLLVVMDGNGPRSGPAPAL